MLGATIVLSVDFIHHLKSSMYVLTAHHLAIVDVHLKSNAWYLCVVIAIFLVISTIKAKK